MKKQLILSILGMISIAFCILSCDTGLSSPSNNDLIGYWRSEKTYQSTFQSTTNNFYDIYIFKQDKVLNFGATSLAYIKSTNYDSAFYADWWDSYTIDDGKLKITSADSGDGYQYTKIIPFRFLDGDLVLTLPAFDVEYMGLSDRNVKYIRLE
jgi:hypothetical protein